MKKQIEILDNLESKIELKDQSNPTISQGDVAWHIDHSLKVINSIITVLKKSNPDEYKWSFHYRRIFLFIVGSIPRGKARAPKSVQTNETITEKDLKRQLETARFLFNEIENLHPNSNVKHPFIGLLNVKDAKKFMAIHTHHHLKIIDDIIKKV